MYIGLPHLLLPQFLVLHIDIGLQLGQIVLLLLHLLIHLVDLVLQRLDLGLEIFVLASVEVEVIEMLFLFFLHGFV